MTSNNPKTTSALIDLLRKQMPTTIANAITGVQPMASAAASLFSLWHDHLKHPWEKVFIIIPRKTIGGRWRIGKINRRLTMLEDGTKDIEHPFGGEMSIKQYKEGYQYATDKELFLLKLEGEHDASAK